VCARDPKRARCAGLIEAGLDARTRHRSGLDAREAHRSGRLRMRAFLVEAAARALR
jgi:hypothetical protein